MQSAGAWTCNGRSGSSSPAGAHALARDRLRAAEEPDRHNGRPVMFAHAAFDLTALAIIYWDLEFDVAHLVFQ